MGVDLQVYWGQSGVASEFVAWSLALVAEGTSHRPAGQSFLSRLYFLGREPGDLSKLSPWEQGQSGDDSKTMGRRVVTRHVCQVWSQISLVQACGLCGLGPGPGVLSQGPGLPSR